MGGSGCSVQLLSSLVTTHPIQVVLYLLGSVTAACAVSHVFVCVDRLSAGAVVQGSTGVTLGSHGRCPRGSLSLQEGSLGVGLSCFSCFAYLMRPVLFAFHNHIL